MKINMVKICDRKWYLTLLLAFLGVLAASLYVMSSSPVLPGCQAVVHAINEVAGKRIERIVLISVVPSGWRKATFLLNGRIVDGNEKYTVSRSLVVSYKQQSNYYHILVEENNKSPLDDVGRGNLERFFPAKGQISYIQVEKIDNKKFMFIDNYSPMFLCTATD